MNGLSAQALALFLVLSPGFLFIVGMYFAPITYPVRVDIQRGVIVDTAIFVVISAALHSTLGLAFLEAANWLSQCDVVGSLASDAGIIAMPGAAKRCTIQTDLLMLIGYSIFLSLAGYSLGVMTVRYAARSPQIFTAIYGPYFDLVQKGAAPYVIADVMTKTVHEGRVVAYEGYLVELSLTGSRAINFVCLEGAMRFYMTLERSAARITPRRDFLHIDANTELTSRITIPGAEIANLVTRAYTGVRASAAPRAE